METDIKHQFEKIYEDEGDAIFRFCMIRVSNRDQALDITQEAFLRLWQTLIQKKEIRHNKAFLFTVAQRLIIDWYRKKKSLSLDQILEEKDERYDVPDEKTFDNLNLRAEGRYLLRKLDELEEGYRVPVYLRFVEGLSPPEIGEILEISANAASVRINRGLAQLREKTGYDFNKEKNGK